MKHRNRDALLIYVCIVIVVLAIVVLCLGCAASVTVGRGEARTCETMAAGDHWSPEAVESLGGAIGEAARKAVRGGSTSAWP